ncbi:MAG: rhomboid family intramembrane serine protease [Phycisphaerales bacterium]|nr:MAG: rhomboid family intramembrane serine protease [Phycisphaerales bacterium]
MGYQDREYAKRPPWSDRGSSFRRGGGLWGGSIVKRLLLANIVMYLLCYMTPLGAAIRGTDPTLGRVRAPDGTVHVVEIERGRPGYCEMITSKVLHGQVWRLITSQYLHANQMHIIFNMIGLYFLGQALERVWGNRKFFVIYTTSGICGNLVLLGAGVIGWINPDVPAVGASGCILGLLGAAAVMFPHAEVYVYMLFPIKIRTAAIIFGLMYVYNVYSRGHNYGGDLCHLAGLVFGAWYAWRGEAWWRQSGFHRTLTGVARSGGGFGRARRASPNPGAWEKKMRQHAVDNEEIDRILAKVHDGGIYSLTAAERRTLTEASEQQREQDQRARRGW